MPRGRGDRSRSAAGRNTGGDDENKRQTRGSFQSPQPKSTPPARGGKSLRGGSASTSPVARISRQVLISSDSSSPSPKKSPSSAKSTPRGRTASRGNSKASTPQTKSPAPAGRSSSRGEASSSAKKAKESKSPAKKSPKKAAASPAKSAASSAKAVASPAKAAASPANAKRGRTVSPKAAGGKAVGKKAGRASEASPDDSSAGDEVKSAPASTERRGRPAKKADTPTEKEPTKVGRRGRSSAAAEKEPSESAAADEKKQDGGNAKRGRARKRTAAGEGSNESDDAGYTAGDEADPAASHEEKKVKLSTEDDTGDGGKPAEAAEGEAMDTGDRGIEEPGFVVVNKDDIPGAESSEAQDALPKDKDSEAAEDLKDFNVISKRGVPLADSDEVLAAVPKQIPEKSVLETSTLNTSVQSSDKQISESEESIHLALDSSDNSVNHGAVPPANTSVSTLNITDDGWAGGVATETSSPPKITINSFPVVTGNSSIKEIKAVYISAPNPTSDNPKSNDVMGSNGADSTDGNGVDGLNGSKPENKDVLLNRTWIKSDGSVGDGSVKPLNSIDLVSYNILAEIHAVRDYHSAEWLGDCAVEKVKMLSRHERLMQELDYLKGDIVCLQEVGTDYFNLTLLPAMKQRGYDGVYYSRQHGYVEGEATFYLKSKLILESYKRVALGKTILEEVDSSLLDEALKVKVKDSLDTMAVALITRLKVLGSTSYSFINIANIHCAWDNLKRADRQCLQLATALKELMKCSGAGSMLNREGYVICGDFNSQPESAQCQLVEDGQLSEKSLRLLQSIPSIPLPDGQIAPVINCWPDGFKYAPACGMKSSYKLTCGADPISTRYSNLREVQAVDYIYYSSQSLTVSGTLQTPDASLIVNGVPDNTFPSDHLSLKARFTFL